MKSSLKSGTTSAVVAKLATLLLLSTAASAQPATALLTAHSSKTHGGTGSHDLSIDITQSIGGLITVEPRAIGTGHTIVLQFNGTISSTGSVSVAPVGTATATFLADKIFLSLTGVPDNQRVSISLVNVNGSFSPSPISIGFLVGDVNGSRTVNASDIAAVKANAGTAASPAKFRFDLNADGVINAQDRSLAKARSGRILPVVLTAGAPVISGVPSILGTVAMPYSFTFGATGNNPITWSVASGTLPPGLSLNPVSGELSGTPTAEGTYSIVVQAVNGEGAALSPVTGSHRIIIAPAQPGGGLLSLDGYLIPYPSKEPNKSGVAHNGLNGAGPLMNAWAVDPVRCNNPVSPNPAPPTTPAIAHAWQQNINFDVYAPQYSNDFFDMAPGEVLSYRFASNQTGAGTITLTETVFGPLVANFMSLTSTPCDFDVTKLAAGASRDFCYQSATRENTIYFQVTAGPPTFITYCKVIPGQVYYLNVRWQDGRIPAAGTGPATDSCADNGSPRCAGLIQIGH